MSGELQPVLDCLASQEGATTIYSGALIKASRPGSDCNFIDVECCETDQRGLCIAGGDVGIELGEFTASLIGCGPEMTPVDSSVCSQPSCSEGEEPEEDGIGGIICVPAGTVPQPQPVSG